MAEEAEEHETNDAPRRQEPSSPGKRPAPLLEVAGPQGIAVTVGCVAAVDPSPAKLLLACRWLLLSSQHGSGGLVSARPLLRRTERRGGRGRRGFRAVRIWESGLSSRSLFLAVRVLCLGVARDFGWFDSGDIFTRQYTEPFALCTAGLRLMVCGAGCSAFVTAAFADWITLLWQTVPLVPVCPTTGALAVRWSSHHGV